MDSVLFSREVDPTELLMDLGFGGGSTAEDIAGRIPTRFLQKSAVSHREHLKRHVQCYFYYSDVCTIVLQLACGKLPDDVPKFMFFVYCKQQQWHDARILAPCVEFRSKPTM